MNFENKTALSTGAASGMGLLFSQNFAALGGNVVMCDVNEAVLNEKVAEINAQNKGRAIGIVCDVRDYAQVCAARDQAIAAFGRIDVLVNFAGGASARVHKVDKTKYPELPDVPIEVYEWGLDVNLKGQLFCAHAIMKEMEKQMSGLVITIGSITGEEGSANAVAYSTAKSAAVTGLTKSLAQAGAPYNIRCVGVAPGPVLTRANMQNMKTLSGKAAEPGELVELMLFIASGRCDALNGTYILADCGRNVMFDKVHGDNGKYDNK